MRQVLLRKPMLHGNVSQMMRADVISQQGDQLTVKLPSELKPRQVALADTLPVEKYFSNLASTGQDSLLMKCYPQGQKSLFSRLSNSR